MSHPDPKHDPENVYPHDSAPGRALKKKLNPAQRATKKWLAEAGKTIKKTEVKKGEAPLQHLKRLLRKYS